MRSELKYLISNDVLSVLRARFSPFVHLDPHGIGYEETGYTVRSIYLDTPDLRYFREKKAGIKVRRKLRIRGYNHHQPNDWVFLEIKRKVEGKISKNRAPLRFENLSELFQTGDVSQWVIDHEHYPNAFDDARRFFYHVYRYNLRPTHTTVYEREAYRGRFDPTLRITFDRNLRGGFYPSISDLYSDEGLRHVRPGSSILEVKFNTLFPGWLRPVLARYELRAQALSKYCLCAEVHRKHQDSKVAVMSQTATQHKRPTAFTKPTPGA